MSEDELRAVARSAAAGDPEPGQPQPQPGPLPGGEPGAGLVHEPGPDAVQQVAHSQCGAGQQRPGGRGRPSAAWSAWRARAEQRREHPFFHIQVVRPTNLAAARGTGRRRPHRTRTHRRPTVLTPCETQQPPNLDALDAPGWPPTIPPPTSTMAGLAAARRGELAGDAARRPGAADTEAAGESAPTSAGELARGRRKR